MVQTINESGKTAFTDLLKRRKAVLLDGGLATQLEVQGCDIGNDLWSASLLQANPAAIVLAHKAYLDAGADCIATASYQASREGYAKLGVSASDADALILLSVRLARNAREEAQSDAAIAASLGPYGAMLHDGSEYHGDYGVASNALHEFHASRLEVLDDSDADVLALETIPSFQEAQVLADLLRDCKTPAWISFSCNDEQHVCDGTPIVDVAALFAEHPTVVAVGVNCTPPQYVASLVRIIKGVLPQKHVVAYPNSGEVYNPVDNSWSGTVTPVDVAAAAVEWVNAGATIVGGCCRMGPEHIEAIGRVIRKQ
jgi:homocysteine S-methyltransferase